MLLENAKSAQSDFVNVKIDSKVILVEIIAGKTGITKIEVKEANQAGPIFSQKFIVQVLRF